MLGEAIDHDEMLRDIGDALEQERIKKMLASHPPVAVDFGFYIGTGEIGTMEDNLREDGIDPETFDWRKASDDLAKVENNLVRILHKNGLTIRTEGHDQFGDLRGTAWVNTKVFEDEINEVGLELVRRMTDTDEPLNTSSGSIMSLKGSEDLFKDCDGIIERIADVSFGIFATEKLKRFLEGIDSGETMQQIMAAISIGESFLAPPEPPGIFRKIIQGCEIYSARCPGCKRIHGNFRTYDQAAGNRQCKFCTRDFVDKMTKVRTTGNFKHLLKKDHEARASKTYR